MPSNVFGNHIKLGRKQPEGVIIESATAQKLIPFEKYLGQKDGTVMTRLFEYGGLYYAVFEKPPFFNSKKEESSEDSELTLESA